MEDSTKVRPQTIGEHAFLSDYSSPTPPVDWERYERAMRIHEFAIEHGISFDEAEYQLINSETE